MSRDKLIDGTIDIMTADREVFASALEPIIACVIFFVAWSIPKKLISMFYVWVRYFGRRDYDSIMLISSKWFAREWREISSKFQVNVLYLYMMHLIILSWRHEKDWKLLGHLQFSGPIDLAVVARS
jgi:hypothetical protein